MKIRLDIHDDLYDEAESVFKKIPNFSFKDMIEEALNMWLVEYNENKR